MEYVNSYSWIEPNHVRAKAEISDYRDRLANYEQNKRDGEQLMLAATDSRDTIQAYFDREFSIGDNEFSAVADVLHDSIRKFDATANRQAREIYTINQRIAEFKELMHNAERRLLPNPERIITKHHIMDMFKSIPQIDENSVFITQTTGVNVSQTLGFVHFNVHDVIMTPDRNPFQNLNFGQPFGISLPKMKVSLALETGKLRIINAYSQPSNTRPAYSGSNVCHPHVLTGNEPCLGDFAGPVAESLAELDFETFGYLLIEFLSQAAHDDSAGQYWWKWAFSRTQLSVLGVTSLRSRIFSRDADSNDSMRILGGGLTDPINGAYSEHLYVYDNDDGILHTGHFSTSGEYYTNRDDYLNLIGANNVEQSDAA